jgi:L-cysteine desulfidase
MTDIKSMLDKRYEIVLEALLMGIPIRYNQEWDLIYHDGSVYECFFNKKDGDPVTKKSQLTLADFLRLYDKISYKDLKTIFANIRLHKLQSRLTKGS